MSRHAAALGQTSSMVIGVTHSAKIGNILQPIASFTVPCRPQGDLYEIAARVHCLDFVLFLYLPLRLLPGSVGLILGRSPCVGLTKKGCAGTCAEK